MVKKLTKTRDELLITMFINKLAEQSNVNSQKMSAFINSFLKTEITCIPRLLNTYLGNYYNNALCNGATWLFMLWCLLHAIYDKACNAFLKKLRYKEYVRTRLKSSLWYLGFFGTALVYCGATFKQNEVELFNFKKMHVLSNSPLPTQVMLGYTLISTFYLHSALWEGLSEGNIVKMFSYFFLFGFMVSSYILRVVETSLSLTALISVTQVALEFTRCCFMASTQDTFGAKLAVGATYIYTFVVYLVIHTIVIPLTFVITLGIKIISDYPDSLLIFLFFNLSLWLVTELYESIVYKLANHWLYHKQIRKKDGPKEDTDIIENTEYVNWCSSTLLECSLFKPRDDDSYNLMILREEIKARKNKMLSMRKPKNMFLQTLKCMVTIKRKLNEKHLSDSSDSDSEKSDNSDLKLGDIIDDKIADNIQSDDDSDNEESESQEDEGIDEKLDLITEIEDEPIKYIQTKEKVSSTIELNDNLKSHSAETISEGVNIILPNEINIKSNPTIDSAEQDEVIDEEIKQTDIQEERGFSEDNDKNTLISEEMLDKEISVDLKTEKSHRISSKEEKVSEEDNKSDTSISSSTKKLGTNCNIDAIDSKEI